MVDFKENYIVPRFLERVPTFARGSNFSRGGPRGVLRYFHTYVGSAHFLGFKIMNFNIFGVFRKMNIFLGYEDFVDIFLGSSQNGLV